MCLVHVHVSYSVCHKPIYCYLLFFTILSAEEGETESVELSKHSSVFTRSILSSSSQTSSLLSLSSKPTSLQRQKLFSPVLATSDYTRKSQHPLGVSQKPRAQVVKTPKAFQQASGVMVPMSSRQDVSSGSPAVTEGYRFSPPSVIAAPGTPAHQTTPEVPEPTPIRPFVFSPPLLRSATRERKSLELSRTAALAYDTASSKYVCVCC